MPINYHPKQGVILLCDFDQGFKQPEMTKRRPVIILTPSISVRPHLATIVALSTTAPNKPMPYHCEIELPFDLPRPFEARKVWVKGDMVNSVGFHRLELFRLGRDKDGCRKYLTTVVGDDIMKQVRKCVLHGLGLSTLTKSL